MKKIGFVDLYISEWHANNYPAWITEANEALGTCYELRYVWAEQETSPVDGVSTDEWCEKYGVERCDSIQELCDKCDAIVILAPSNPEKHVEYARVVLPFGKPTYIDKPFADKREDAIEMFEIAKKHNTTFFSSSALRYATELSEAGECVAVSTVGGGKSFEEYGIHQIEMIVKKLGVGAKNVRAEKLADSQFVFTIDYDDDRKAAIHFVQGGTPFVVSMSPKCGGDAVYRKVESSFFKNLIKDILTMFEKGKFSFDVSETMEVNRILVAAISAKNSPGVTVKI